jgi:hypothetical protein
MLDYWVSYIDSTVGSTVTPLTRWSFLKQTNSEAANVDQFAVGNTMHRYRVVGCGNKIRFPYWLTLRCCHWLSWHVQIPHEATRASCCQVDMIEEPQQQRNISACAEILKFDQKFVRQFLREEFMRESTIYQEILHEGESNLVLRQLARRVGQISPEVRSRIQQLPLAQLEVGEALLDFGSMQDLTDWLQTR